MINQSIYYAPKEQIFFKNCPVKAKISPAKDFLLRFLEFSSNCRTKVNVGQNVGQWAKCRTVLPNVGRMASLLVKLGYGLEVKFLRRREAAVPKPEPWK